MTTVATTVTANTRLARGLKRRFDRERLAAGDKFWETPDILEWHGWVARLWEDAVYAGRERRVLLSAAQEQVLWEQAISASEVGRDLLNPAGTARMAARAWKLLQEGRLPRNEAAFAEVPDTAAFFGWSARFEKALRAQGFITQAEVPEALLRMGFERAERYAGFDELTPIQAAMFEGAEEFELPVPVMRSWRKAAVPDADQEMRYAARWAREQLEQNPTAKVGVVFPDLAARSRAAARIFEEVLGTAEAFHVSEGEALAEVPMVAGALLALKLCAGLTLAEAGVLLRSPYFGFGAQEGARADAALRRRGLGSVTLANVEVARPFPGLAAQKETRRPGAWSAAFSKLAQASGWPGRRTLSSVEYQAAKSWRELLGEFAKLDAVLGEMEFGAALTRLERLARETGFGPEEEDEPVQVMDVAEAAGSRFDVLWIGGLHDGTWPEVARANPFLPLAMQPTIERRFAMAKAATSRMWASAAVGICSWPMREGEAALRPSPFLAGMAAVELGAIEVARTIAVLEEVRDDAAPALGGKRLVKGGMAVIADQSACAFRAFARHRLGARGLEEAEPGLTAREQGDVMHGALERIWKALGTKRALVEMEAGELRGLVAERVREAVADKVAEGSRGLRRIQQIEARRVTKLLMEWLEIERGRPGFAVEEVEGKRRHSVGGVELDIRVDRVDRYEDGSIGILDYKTGTSSEKSHWETERPEAPQLPLYATALNERVSTVAFAQVAAGKLKLKEVEAAERIGEWKRVVEALGAQFAAGEAAVNPRPGACDYCDLAGLCRVAEMSSKEVDE